MEIEIKGIHKSFAGTPALLPTDLKLRQGEFTTLLGPSGCGKTTLLRMIAGLEQPDGGEIYSAGKCIYSASKRTDVPAHKRQFGMVFQDFALWPHMTVFENVAFGLKAAKQYSGLKEKVTEALAMVRLQGMEDRYPHQLSGGQQQRVAFARAVAIRPALVLFDEPLSALDAVLREEMRVEMMSLVKDMGLTALYVTHDQIEAMSMSDEIVVMRKGEVLQRGTPESIYKAPSHPFVASFIGKSNWLEPERAMVRPEQVKWSRTSDDDRSYAATVRHVSYVGERYEIRLQVDGLDEWTVYSSKRATVQERVELYVSPESICWMQGADISSAVQQQPNLEPLALG
ncbi:ATP-binding cassette domain-containing protein [Paenibacillus campinasensis]|uniref:ATP-binding cassette domain-containing protein n=1 Tax=Paenibacillus campinasensis TaxID=66347 RepID=A0ABW9T3N1_9BACL|nr:ABC transporter ATP-binding protein [Paenibacillus campinasensis]MUG67317.1 ATP-binding cassette domain-containing protein [Paenibacillus campinasensis]